MKLIAISTLALISSVFAADVQYSVVAFPSDNQAVSVSVNGGQTVVALQKSTVHPNLFTGSAPFSESYQYVLGTTPESTTRKLAQGVSSTGNEFFNRSQTIYDVPGLPQAFNPIYPTLFTNLNKSNEIATIIMSVNATQLDAINKQPTAKLDDARISDFAYISNKEVFTFQNGGLSTSGQSTKDFAKQSYAIDINGYVPKGTSNSKNLLYGRTVLKLRAEETDATFAREKLVLDMLAASGGATLSGSWVRVFINNEPYGLFLLMDEASTHFIDAILHGGNFQNPTTGVTYKGNALSTTQEGNLVYVGDNNASYPEDLYKLADNGEDKTISKKNDSQRLIVDFAKRLSQVNATDATDAQHPGSIANLIDPQHTLIHIAINFLIGSWDGFWYQASNYYLNNDLANNKWTLITYDFDEVYGNGLEDAALNTATYQTYARPGSQRPLVEVFLNNTYYDSVFQTTLKTIVKRFFKPSIVTPRLNAWSQMLQEDIAWSRGIAGHSPGTTTAYTLQDFHEGLTGNSTASITQWVTTRVNALKTQLNFDDTDDLPALPAYTQGTYLDANGNVVSSNGSAVNSNTGSVTPGGNSSSTNNNNTHSSSSGAASQHAPMGITLTTLVALFYLAL